MSLSARPEDGAAAMEEGSFVNRFDNAAGHPVRAARACRPGADLAAAARTGGDGSPLGSLPTLPSATLPSVAAHQRIADEPLVCLARDLALRCAALARSGELRAPKRLRPTEPAEESGIVSDDENCSSGGDSVDKDHYAAAGGPGAGHQTTTSSSRSKRVCAAGTAPEAAARLPSSQGAESACDSAMVPAAEGCMGPPSSSQPATEPSSAAAKAAARRMVAEALPGAVVRSVRSVEGADWVGGGSPLEVWRRDAHHSAQASAASGLQGAVDASVSFLWLLQDGIPAGRIGAAVASLHRRAADLVTRGRIPNHASVPTKVQPRVRLNVTRSALLAVADAAIGRHGPQAASLRAALDAAASAPCHRRPGVFVRFEIVLVAACLGKVSSACGSAGAASTALDASCLAVAASVPSGSHSLEVVPPHLPHGASAPILTVASPCQVSPALIVAVDLPVPARALSHLVQHVASADAGLPAS
ncbi:hypothetical protein FNF31_01140 [Cafeteria roenbergensis]|uniref:Uncharacterized protein n=1 Tax=Cafeteria roenbergensis TaxID=33653 RepID=A0A5A8CBL5_CAFRO|nr:hypothetical protein FNF28_07379 [Cafeteria roenbergensis]KAA0166765.1 hypothetical protein FNF31_01140 [Cafeteria roenbergensis]